MRVAILTSAFPPERNGISTIALTQALGLASVGCDVTVLPPTYSASEHLGDGLSGIATLSYPSSNTFGYPGSPRLRLGHSVRRALRRLTPDVVLVHEPEIFRFSSLRDPALPRRRQKVPTLGCIHCVYSQLRRHFPSNSLRARLPVSGARLDAWTASAYRRHATTLCFSTETRRYLQNLGVANTLACPVGIEDAFFQPRTTHTSRTDALLFVGRLTRDKGVDHLLRTFRKIRAARPSARLTVVGSGPERRSLALQPGVDLLGTESRAALPAVYRRHKILLLLSRHDTLGLTAVEAIASGVLPLVSSDAGIARQLLASGCRTLVVDPEAASANSRRVLSLLDDIAMRVGLLRRLRPLIRPFSLDVASRALLRILESQIEASSRM